MNDLPLLPPISSRHAPAPAVWVTGHALERIREHYPDAGAWAAGRLLLAAVEVSGEIACEMLRRRQLASADRYFLAADRRGLFVVAPGTRPGSPFAYSLVTYLRFSPWQAELAARLYPLPAAEPSEVIP